MFRHHANRTLLGGWWGGVLAIPIFLLVNRIRLRRVLRLAPPQPTPGVAAHSPAPLDPGKPVIARPGGIMAIVVLSLLVVVFCGGLASLAFPPN
jgi:hypothetical protein